MAPKRRAPGAVDLPHVSDDANYRGDAGDDGNEGARPLAFLSDRDAFMRRFLLSLALAPPPSVARWRRKHNLGRR